MTVNAVTYILVVIFGSSSWLSTNSIWMELPLLTSQLPEGWSLPSYLTAVVQLACIGPLFYSIVHKCSNYTVPTAPTIQILLVFCTAITAALAYFWPVTISVLGNNHSVALIGIMFGMALVNATSNVLFMPYMSMYHPSYLTAYFVGMGLSSLVPSIVSLVQGTGRYDCILQNSTGTFAPQYYPARFDVSTFNLVMFGWMSLATVSFALLHWTPLGGPKELKSNKSSSSELPPDEASPLQQLTNLQPKENKTQTYARYFVLLFLVAFNCAQMNGIVPSIQSFAMLPYSQMTYHLALTLSNIASPIVCFLPLLISPKTVFSMSMLTGLATLFTGFIVVLAASSPDPIGREFWWGSVIAIVCSVVASSLHSYLRTVFAGVLCEGAKDKESRLFWCGVFIQIGSFIGSTIMFPLVNVYSLFTSAPACR